MLPKKLFTPKCLHLDRDIVFREDILNFFRSIIQYLKESEKTIIDYSAFKQLYKDKKISMLHFSKSKEENQKEYYEVLFGEIQSFMFEDRLKDNEKEYSFLFRIFSIFTLYSVYYTQTTDYFYQANTIPEYLIEINKLISALSLHRSYLKVRNEIIVMVNRLFKDEAFSIGTVIGLKTIILNKYGLPLELKENTFNDYIDINTSANKLNSFDNKGMAENLNFKFGEYNVAKKGLIEDIKSLCSEFEGFNMEAYCNFINNTCDSNVKKEDVVNKNIGELDILLNQVDNKLYNVKNEN
jgi:hypothetical protein